MVREFKRLGLGRVLVTAYTGVAAAPFGGPTLLKLLNLNLRTRSNSVVLNDNAVDRQRMCHKFENECGEPIEEFGLVVIDEISFIDTVVLGHIDKGLAILKGNTELCGGMTMLLCGDNHQKPPPGGTPWYQYIVKVAAKEIADPVKQGASFAKQRGVTLLASAKRIQLTRLMRAATDSAFIEFQLRLRQTELLHPISDDFLRQLRKVSASDVARDPAW